MLAEAVDMKEAVKEEMERRSPNCRIQLAEVRKNNGLLLHGISIYAPGSTMAPTIYIDGYIQQDRTDHQADKDPGKLSPDRMYFSLLLFIPLFHPSCTPCPIWSL